MSEQALSDVKVLDLTWYIAGPYCTKLLADYGADVVKVERPGAGDPARSLSPFFKDDPHPEKSGLFAHLNTNKKSITLNLKSAAGNKIFRELVRDVDILVESFSPRVMSSLGLSYDELEAVNPGLVMTSISNFGQSGPYRDFKSSELILYGMGGAMSWDGLPEREPLKKGGTVVLFSSGSHAAAATMVALIAARAQGTGRPFQTKGQHVDISLFETQLVSIDRRMSGLVFYQYNKEVTPRIGPRGLGIPYGPYPCQDGHFDAAGGWTMWPRIARMIGRPDLANDPRWATAEGQTSAESREEFDAIYLSWLMERTKGQCTEAGQAAGVLCGPVNSSGDLINDPHWKVRAFWAEVEHPVTGRLTYPGAPAKMSETPWQVRNPAPLLGQHNHEIYGRLGYSKEDLAKLRVSGVI